MASAALVPSRFEEPKTGLSLKNGPREVVSQDRKIRRFSRRASPPRYWPVIRLGQDSSQQQQQQRRVLQPWEEETSVWLDNPLWHAGWAFVDRPVD